MHSTSSEEITARLYFEYKKINQRAVKKMQQKVVMKFTIRMNDEHDFGFEWIITERSKSFLKRKEGCGSF